MCGRGSCANTPREVRGYLHIGKGGARDVDLSHKGGLWKPPRRPPPPPRGRSRHPPPPGGPWGEGRGPPPARPTAPTTPRRNPPLYLASLSSRGGAILSTNSDPSDSDRSEWYLRFAWWQYFGSCCGGLGGYWVPPGSAGAPLAPRSSPLDLLGSRSGAPGGLLGGSGWFYSGRYCIVFFLFAFQAFQSDQTSSLSASFGVESGKLLPKKSQL